MIKKWIKCLLKRNAKDNNKKSKYDDISFKEGFCLTNLPICIFFQGNKSFTFLLDTGSDDNVIDSTILSEINYKELDEKTTLMGLDGIENQVGTCIIRLEYKNKSYESMFLSKDMSKPFAEIKKQTGVTLHGILGSKFFKLFQFVLDFDSLIAYSKLTLQKSNDNQR